MHDDSVLVAIDAALRSPASCACGRNLTIATRDGAAWLECTAFAEPTRLPAAVASALRGFLHTRSFVIEVPAPDERESEDLSRAVKVGCPAPTGV